MPSEISPLIVARRLRMKLVYEHATCSGVGSGLDARVDHVLLANVGATVPYATLLFLTPSSQAGARAGCRHRKRSRLCSLPGPRETAHSRKWVCPAVAQQTFGSLGRRASVAQSISFRVGRVAAAITHRGAVWSRHEKLQAPLPGHCGVVLRDRVAAAIRRRGPSRRLGPGRPEGVRVCFAFSGSAGALLVVIGVAGGPSGLLAVVVLSGAFPLRFGAFP